MKALGIVLFFVISINLFAQTENYQSAKLEKQWEIKGFDIPESVIMSVDKGVIYVANIAGKDLAAKDSNGFISKIKPDGTVIDFKWGVGLNGPKGMAIYNKSLYVTDIDRIVVLSLETGKIIESIPVKGAVFLNDIVVNSAGTFIISDSRASTYYTLSENGVEKLMSDSTLYFPNGLCIDEDRIISGVGDRIISFTAANPVWKDIIMETGRTDGLSKIGENAYIKSDWKGKIHLVYTNKVKELLLDTTPEEINAADFYYNEKTRRLFVPTFYNNAVVCYKLDLNK
jgi:sugar lactone lactonase YvrE